MRDEKYGVRKCPPFESELDSAIKSILTRVNVEVHVQFPLRQCLSKISRKKRAS